MILHLLQYFWHSISGKLWWKVGLFFFICGSWKLFSILTCMYIVSVYGWLMKIVHTHKRKALCHFPDICYGAGGCTLWTICATERKWREKNDKKKQKKSHGKVAESNVSNEKEISREFCYIFMRRIPKHTAVSPFLQRYPPGCRTENYIYIYIYIDMHGWILIIQSKHRLTFPYHHSAKLCIRR